jgi:hypothetical protein
MGTKRKPAGKMKTAKRPAKSAARRKTPARKR